jgi:hypothetical protein
MPLDPRSLRSAADQASAEASAKREADRRAKLRKAVDEFPEQLTRFLAAVEEFVQAVAEGGSHSAVVLEGRGACDDVEVPEPRYVKTSAVAATRNAANAILAKMAELNNGSSGIGGLRWGSGDSSFTPLEDFSVSVANHFRTMGFSVVGYVHREGRNGYFGKVEVSW